MERLCREIFFEGIRLGERLHPALYDWGAGTCDAGKKKVQKDGARPLVDPPVERLERSAANTPDAHFREFQRVLKPGGILLLSRNTEGRGRAGAVCPPERFAEHLRSAGFERIEVRPGWERFDLAWAGKPTARPGRAPR